MPTPTVNAQRAHRARKLGMLFAALLAGVVLAIRWLVRKTWRRLLPLYWIGAELGIVWVSRPMGITARTVAVAVVALLVTAAAWPARSRLVRLWRAAIVAVLGTFAVATTAAGGPAALSVHPTLTVFLPTLAGIVLGWPWWHHLRQAAAPAELEPILPEPVGPAAPVVDELTARWIHRWDQEVVGEGVCGGTRVLQAEVPRDGVVQLTLKLSAGQGMKVAAIMKKGPEVETALELDEGAVGFQSTGKASRVRCVLVERSYVAAGVPWTGPTYRNGRCMILTYVDGSAGGWTFMPPGFGVKGGLVVGSSGSGKSRALGVLIANLLEAGWMVPVGDSQNGQSLPAWKGKTEYHAGVEAVILLIRRLHAEIMYRSARLAEVGVEVFDENDPRVQALGFKKMMAVIDECQLVLVRGTPIVVLAEQAAETMRKTGVGIIYATQLPQMGSLGGSIRLRDALVAGNTLVLRLSNRGSSSSILPDDFVGDPFAIKSEDEEGRPTAGMGYLRNSSKVGMIGRVPKLDEIAAAAAAPTVEVSWLVDAIAPGTPFKPAKDGDAAGDKAAASGGAGNKLREMFGLGRKPAQEAAEAVSSADWVLACLRRGPASAQALLDRPDCPVKQAQLYALLKTLSEDRGLIVRSPNGAFAIAEKLPAATR
jgi:hypothetical protein